ncbi:MAG: hypothetical protein Q8K60_00585 [Parachlamydiaceae bacterium]|nr:hypothetical protein [Parachlamydiaceae bacterium]
MLKNIKNFINNTPQFINIDQKFYGEKANSLIKKISECSAVLNNLTNKASCCLKNNKYKIICAMSYPLMLGIAYLIFIRKNKNQKSESIPKPENLENNVPQQENTETLDTEILVDDVKEETNENESNKNINNIHSFSSDEKEELIPNQEIAENKIVNQDNQPNHESSESNPENELNNTDVPLDDLKNSSSNIIEPEFQIAEPIQNNYNDELKDEIKIYQQQNYIPLKLEYKYLEKLNNLRDLTKCFNNNYFLNPFDFFKSFTTNNIFHQCHDFNNTKLIIPNQIKQPNPYIKNPSNSLDSTIFKFNYSGKSIYNQILDSTADQNTIHLFTATTLYDLSIVEEKKQNDHPDGIMKQSKGNQTPGALTLRTNPMLFEMIHEGLTKNKFNMLEKVGIRLCANGYLTPNDKNEQKILNLFIKNQTKFQIPYFASYPCNLFNQEEKKPVYMIFNSAPNYKEQRVLTEASKELQYVSAYYNFYYQLTAIVDISKNHRGNAIIYHPSAIGVVELNNDPEIVGQAFYDVAEVFQDELKENNVKIQFEIHYNENSNESELEIDCARAAGFDVSNP